MVTEECSFVFNRVDKVIVCTRPLQEVTSSRICGNNLAACVSSKTSSVFNAIDKNVFIKNCLPRNTGLVGCCSVNPQVSRISLLFSERLRRV